MTTTSDSLATALARVQGKLTAVTKGKTANAGQYSYTYADLAAVQAAVMPLLAEEGLAWVARPTLVDDRFVLHYSLTHGASGEREDGLYPLPDPTRGTPQQMGSALTYARRYCLSAVAGVATEDDDGAAASDARAPQPQRREKKAERGPATDDPWASTPAASIPVVTDAGWATDFRERVAGCDSMGDLRGLFDELSAQVKASAVAKDDAADLRALVEEQAADLTKQAERVTS